MNVRKERTHQCGLTNIDFRTKGDQLAADRFNPSLKFADVGTMSKSHFKRTPSDVGFKDHWQINGGWQTMRKPDPRNESAIQFYNAQGKKPKAPVLVASKRTQELEREEWTDKVFTGDNPKVTAALSMDASKRDYAVNPKKNQAIEATKLSIQQRLAQQLRANQAETLANSLAGQVTEKSVRDIRRALRRKYASRTNLHRIFAQWDRENKGAINANDLFYGLNKVGIKTTYNEAVALHASAKQLDSDPNISLQEFSELLFSNDEKFNVDLQSMKPASQDEIQASKDLLKTIGATKCVDLSALSKENLQKYRERNQWKFCMQKNLNDIVRDLQNIDTDKSFQADPRDFLKVVQRRARAPGYLEQEQLIDYVLNFQDQETGKICYKQVADDLRAFNYDLETNEGILPKSSASITSGRLSIAGNEPMKNVFTDDYVVLDSQRVPPNKIELIERRLIKVNRHLVKKFKTKEALNEHLRDKADTDKNGNLSVDEFKAFLLESCAEELVQRKLTKQDLEGFLSAFVYNRHGSTNIDNVAPLVFESNMNKLSQTIVTAKRANPPPVFTNQELGAIDAKVLDNGADESEARRLRALLREIEDKTFEGKPKMFEAFRRFDVDGDGFVSYKDFENHILANKVNASKEEIASLMKNVLDTDGDGFIDFKTFTRRFGPNMSHQVQVNDKELHLPNLVPNKEKLHEYGTKQQGLRESIYAVRKEFQPQVDQKLIPATRFSAKPAHPNTFLNHQAGPKTPGFISEADRVGVASIRNNSVQTKVQFQQEEKARQLKVQESRVADKRRRAEAQSAQRAMEEQDKVAKDTTRILRKAGNLDTYEKLCHLRR